MLQAQHVDGHAALELDLRTEAIEELVEAVVGPASAGLDPLRRVRAERIQVRWLSPTCSTATSSGSTPR